MRGLLTANTTKGTKHWFTFKVVVLFFSVAVEMHCIFYEPRARKTKFWLKQNFIKQNNPLGTVLSNNASSKLSKGTFLEESNLHLYYTCQVLGWCSEFFKLFPFFVSCGCNASQFFDLQVKSTRIYKCFGVNWGFP